jgi:hypothetical protein
VFIEEKWDEIGARHEHSAVKSHRLLAQEARLSDFKLVLGMYI